MGQATGYIGTYASPESLGIYRFTVDRETGALTAPILYYEADGAKYISIEGGKMAAPVERDGKAGVCLLRAGGPAGVLLDEDLQEAKSPCHVAQDGGWLFTANYHEGHVMAYRTDSGKLKFEARIAIGRGAGCHQALPFGRYLLVPCLALDCIRIFDREEAFAPAGEIRFPPGTGPRHGALDEGRGRLYVVSELSNKLYMFRIEQGQPPRFGLEQALGILPQGAVYLREPASAAIRLSGDGRHVYVSTRSADVITVFEAGENGVSKVQQVGSGGFHPRDICLVPPEAPPGAKACGGIFGEPYGEPDGSPGGGGFLLAVNRTGGGLVSFPVERGTGLLGEACSRVPAPEGVSVILDGV